MNEISIEYKQPRLLGIVGKILDVCSFLGFVTSSFFFLWNIFSQSDGIPATDPAIRELTFFGILTFSAWQMMLASKCIADFAKTPSQFFTRVENNFKVLWVMWSLLTVFVPVSVVFAFISPWSASPSQKDLSYGYLVHYLWIAIISTLVSGALLLVVAQYKKWMKLHGLI